MAIDTASTIKRNRKCLKYWTNEKLSIDFLANKTNNKTAKIHKIIFQKGAYCITTNGPNKLK